MHKRNVSGMKKYAEMKHQRSIENAEDAIKLLLRNGDAISFASVARTANVSTSWLYTQDSLAERIKRLRRNGKVVITKNSQRASDLSKDVMIRNLKDQLRNLRQENKELKHQLSIAYGQIEELTSRK